MHQNADAAAVEPRAVAARLERGVCWEGEQVLHGLLAGLCIGGEVGDEGLLRHAGEDRAL